MKTLKMVKMGMDLHDDDIKKSDLGNYRLRIYYVNKKGEDIFGCIMFWNRPYTKGKKCLYEKEATIFFDLAHEITGVGKMEDGTYGYSIEGRFPYTKAGVLEAINSDSKDVYNNIEIVEREDD